jgi:pimeloyl-ACP methyl ester carboxylesterase
MDQLADDAAALLDELGAGPAIVFAHSYGGFVAQELVLRHPEAVRALVLVDTTAGQLGETESPDDEQGPPLPPEAAALMSTLPATDAELEALSPKMLPFYLHSTPIEQVLPLMRGTLYSASAMARGFEVLAGWSSIERLPRVAVPTLLLWGRHDLVTSFPQARRIANRIPGCEVVVLDKSGHMPWIEEPGQFFPALEDWLRRNGLI